MLQPVAITLSVSVVAHHFGQEQCAEHVADPLDAPAHCARLHRIIKFSKDQGIVT